MGGGNGNCYKRGDDGGEGGRGGTAYCYFTMLKDQEYTVKLAATDWASIGYNTGNSLYGPQSTPTGMKDNEGGLGGGMSIIYIGNRVFAVCGGGGGGGKEGNGGDGGGCNVSASNGDGPSHGYGSNLSSAGEYRNGLGMIHYGHVLKMIADLLSLEMVPPEEEMLLHHPDPLVEVAVVVTMVAVVLMALVVVAADQDGTTATLF